MDVAKRPVASRTPTQPSFGAPALEAKAVATRPTSSKIATDSAMCCSRRRTDRRHEQSAPSPRLQRDLLSLLGPATGSDGRDVRQPPFRPKRWLRCGYLRDELRDRVDLCLVHGDAVAV